MREWPASGGPFSFPSPATNPRPFFVDRTRRDEWDNFVLPVQRALPRLKTAAAAGRHRDTLADLLAGRSRPHSRTRERLTAVSRGRATSAARLGARVWGLCAYAVDGSCSATSWALRNGLRSSIPKTP